MATNAIQARRADTTSAGGGNHRSGRASRILLCTCNRGLRPRQRMYQPSGLGTDRPRRKHHAHILRTTVRHHMPLVSTEDLIWPIKLRALCASVFQSDFVGNLGRMGIAPLRGYFNCWRTWPLSNCQIHSTPSWPPAMATTCPLPATSEQ